MMLDGAVRNNAAWVAAVHAAHGHAGQLEADLWLTHDAPLPFYPNAVTLTQAGVAAQAARLRNLVLAGLPMGWGIKDSYASLDLAPLGFQPLFEAQWIGRVAGSTAAASERGLRWVKVGDATALTSWERAWRGEPTSSTESPTLFPPGLLRDPDIAFLGAYESDATGGAPVAGLIVNRSGDGASAVAGVSNLFLPPGRADNLRVGALAAAEAAFPGLPLVGYERGDDLDAMHSLGFEALGSLRVWEYVSDAGNDSPRLPDIPSERARSAAPG
jgi:hypothetical protein